VGLVLGALIGLYGLAPSSRPAPATGGADSGDSADSTAGGGRAAPTVHFKMASAYPGELVQSGTRCRALEREIAAVSDGRVRLQFFEPGALVPAFEIFDAVSSGAVDAGCSVSGFWAGKIAALQIFAAIPFGPEHGEFLAWIYYGGGEEMFRELYARHNIHGMHCGLVTPEASGWFRTEITTLEDLKGLKMRFFGLGAKVMDKLGVSTQLLAAGDIFPALELGTIDATEYSTPAADLKLGLYQVAKHYYFPGWHQPATLGELLINMDRWRALTAADKALFEMACSDNIRRGIAEGEAIQFQALADLEARGVILHKWPPEILDAFRAAWDQVVAEEVARDADFARAWASLSAFRKRYKLWSALAYIP
jgi:TRAP-type mannitol/chloroaromatic compound transport system substrate-binding protein